MTEVGGGRRDAAAHQRRQGSHVGGRRGGWNGGTLGPTGEADGTAGPGVKGDDGPDPGTTPAEDPPGPWGAARRDERAPTSRRRAGGPPPGDAGLFNPDFLPDICTSQRGLL